VFDTGIHPKLKCTVLGIHVRNYWDPWKG